MMNARTIVFFSTLTLAAFQANNSAAALPVQSLPQEVRSRGGLCVVVGGAADIPGVESLLKSGPWVVHWLHKDIAAVASARLSLQQRGLYGQAAVEHWTAARLPHADNLVNLLIVLDEPSPIGRQELLRVLAPECSAFLNEGSKLVRHVKPRPAEMGEWTHPWNGADGNMVSSDRALGIPNGLQWLAGPLFPVDGRKSSSNAVVSTGGRVFYVSQNVPENVLSPRPGSPNHLIARDAFNGVLLWKQPWEGPLNATTAHTAVLAEGDRVFGVRDKEVVILDAATGKSVAIWPLGTTPNKLLLERGVLVSETPGGLNGFDIEKNRPLWSHSAKEPWGTLVRDGKAFCLLGSRQRDGRWLHEVLAVDLGSGEELWRRQVESEHALRNSPALRLHFAADGVVCLIDKKLMQMLAAEDGRELWRRQTDAQGRDGWDTRLVGHFFAHGLVWMRGNDASRARDSQETWHGLDPRTGEQRKELTTSGLWPSTAAPAKMGCQPLMATERFLIFPRQATFVDMASGEKANFKFARGGCVVGAIPANGLAYVTPHACGCYYEAVRGFLSVVSSDDPGLREIVPAQLERGPAYGQTLSQAAPDDTTSWPMYRRDGRRSASMPAKVPANLAVRWEASLATASPPMAADQEWQLRLGQPLTAPVIAAGLVVLAQPQTHQVIALDENTGKARWRFTAGGRIDTPPTLYRGLCLFGSRDGYVYCLRASDGELVWRRRAAPSDRRIMAYGQLESAWPLAGSVLVHEGVVLAAAGRAPDADGGIVVLAVEPATGKLLWTQRVSDASYGQCDILVTDDSQNVYLLDKRLDVRTGNVAQAESKGKYLRGGKAGLLETGWTRFPLALRKDLQTWTWGQAKGQILAFSDDAAFAFQVAGNDSGSKGGGQLVAHQRDEWSVTLPAPLQVEAMLSTNDTLFVAGPLDRAEPLGGGFLRAVAHEKGRDLVSISLPAAPVHDGLAAVGGRLFAVLRDGRVLCLAPK